MSWREFLSRHYTAATIEEYEREVSHYLRWLGGEAVALTADYATVVRYLGHLRDRYDKLASPRRIMAAVKVYHRYLLVSGQRSDHPAVNIVLRGGPPRNGSIQLQNLLDAGELQSLLDAPVEYYGLHAGRGVPMVSLLVHQALCAREVAGLRVWSLDLKAGAVTVPTSFRTLGRTLPLSGSQVMSLHGYLTEKRPRLLRPDRPTDRLFLTLRGGEEEKQNVDIIVNKLRPVAGGKLVTPLMIRQSVIAGKLRRGEGLREVQVFAGHKRISTTEDYRETGLRELRRAVDRFHPLATH